MSPFLEQIANALLTSMEDDYRRTIEAGVSDVLSSSYLHMPSSSNPHLSAVFIVTEEGGKQHKRSR
jgi:hypothetical protein